MNPVNNAVISAAANTGTVTSAAIQAQFFTSISAQVFFTDAAAEGTLKIQASNDATSPTHWNDITNASVTVAAGATSLIVTTALCYHWVRLSWTQSAGAGTLTARFNAQELT